MTRLRYDFRGAARAAAHLTFGPATGWGHHLFPGRSRPENSSRPRPLPRIPRAVASGGAALLRASILAGLAAAAWPTGAALAQTSSDSAETCPVGDDLASGFSVTYANGDVTRFSQGTANTVVELTSIAASPGETSRVEALGGVFLLSDRIVEHPAEPPFLTGYPFDPAAHLPLAPGQHWAEQILEGYGSGQANQLRMEVQVYDARRREIGPCSYDVLPYQLRYGPEGQADATVFMEFVPDLGVTLTLGSKSRNGSRALTDPVRIIAANRGE